MSKIPIFFQISAVCENCAFPENFHTEELGEITVFYADNV